MVQIGVFLLANVFSALLPPVDPDEKDFFDILGVERNATNEEIRKAYKKQSLKLHPDKIAQRGDRNPEEAAAEYELVQEAYSVLVNEEKRQRYQTLNYSPKRYRFVSQGTLQNPGAMYENLTSASFVDKTRLVVLCSLIVMMIMMQPILICTKINHLLAQDGGSLQDTKWTVIFIPYWIIGAALICFWSGIVFVAPPTGGARIAVLLTVLEQVFWYIGVIVLARKWDGKSSQSYGVSLIPIYLAMITRWIQSMLLLQKLRTDVQKMVSLDFLEKEILEGKSMEDLSEQELEDIRNNYVVVTVPPDFVPILPEGDEEGQVGDLDEKELEGQKVEASPEFQNATELYNDTFGGLVVSLIFGLVFIILITLKLDGKIDGSYWVVFTPIWIQLGSRWLYNLYGCMCATVSGEEIVLHMAQQAEDAANNSDGDDDGEVPERPNDSTFVDPDASARLFNESVKLDQKTKDEAQGKAEETSGKEKPAVAAVKESETTKDDQKEEKIKTKKDDDEKSESANDTKKDDETKDKKDDGDDDDDDDDASSIKIDDETFHAFQSAYDEAEKSAMEEQAKSSAECFSLTIRIMLLCMIVGKVDKNADIDINAPDHDGDDVGFNTFWIIFPFLLFFGCVFCCCSFLIYGAAPGSASDLYGENEDGGDVAGFQDEENPTGTTSSAGAGAPAADSTPIVMAPPPPPSEPTATTSTNVSTAGAATTTLDATSTKDDSTIPAPGVEETPSPPEEDIDMEDLD